MACGGFSRLPVFLEVRRTCVACCHWGQVLNLISREVVLVHCVTPHTARFWALREARCLVVIKVFGTALVEQPASDSRGRPTYLSPMQGLGFQLLKAQRKPWHFIFQLLHLFIFVTRWCIKLTVEKELVQRLLSVCDIPVYKNDCLTDQCLFCYITEAGECMPVVCCCCMISHYFSCFFLMIYSIIDWMVIRWELCVAIILIF